VIRRVLIGSLRLSSVRVSLLVLVLLAGLPGLALTLYTGLEQRRSTAARVQAEAMQLVRLTSAEEKRLIDETRVLLIDMARHPEVRRRQDAACTALLLDLLRLYPRYANLGAVDPAGNAFCSAVPFTQRVNIADRAYFRRAVQTRGFAVGEYQIGRITGKASVNAGYPVLDSNGRVQAVVFAALSLGWLNELAAEAQLPPGAALSVVDARGTILARHPDPERWVGRSLPEVPSIKAILVKGGEGTTEATGVDGVRRLYAFAPLTRLPEAGGPFVSIGIPTAVAYAGANRLLLRNFVGMAVVILVALAAAWWAGDLLLLRRLQALVRATNRLGTGDLSVRTGVPHGGGEFGRLARAFDDMADALQKREAEAIAAEAALRASEERLRLLVEQLPAIVWTMDPELRFTSSQGAGLANLGLRPDQVVGKTIYEYFQTDDPEFPPIAAHRGAVRGESVTYDLGWGSRAYQNHVEPLRDTAGRMIGVLGIALDVTERERARETVRQAEAANLAKSEFLSRMSHELRTPLHSVLGFAQLLQMDSLRAEQAESVQQILKAGRHLLELINEVLDITGIEAGRVSVSPEPVQVGELVRESLDLIAPMAAAKHIHLHGRTAGASDAFVRADRQRLKQVLLNLLSNAVKYNRPEGTVVVALSEPAPRLVRILVSDTGPGIPADRLERLFKPFERLHADQMGVEGIGLGLALSKRLVEAMGGQIGVETTVGAGSTFWVELPLVQSPLDASGLAAAGPTRPGEVERTILYVEDNLANVRLVERILARRPGVRLLTAMQGRLGLDLIREHRPDLVLLDINLSDLQGDEVMRLLREDARTKEIPIVVISATEDRRILKRLLAEGARAYLTKPLDAQRLLSLLDEILPVPVAGEQRS